MTSNEISSLCHQGLTPPDSPTKWAATPQAMVKDLKHLFAVFLDKVSSDLTNQDPPNAPVSQHQSPEGLDMVQLKQLLVNSTREGCASAELSMATEPDQPSSASSEHDGIQVGTDLESPICTTLDGFKSFEKWASTPQFKTVVETYEPPTPLHGLLKIA